MDFDESPDDIEYRKKARAWLEQHAPKRTGRDDWSTNQQHPEYVKRCKDWQGTLAEHGWAAITWPKEYGGQGGTSRQAALFAQEQAAFDVSTGVFAVGIGMVGPTLIAHGTEEQKQRFLPALLKGEEVWCQLFSEPGAGSDLAGLSSRAVRDGDEWVVNGQKVWNSGAHYSDWGILLARTDVDQPKHRGITYFLVDMKTPGIDVRPLRQITGHAHFNEVFLSDVRIPHENIVGEQNAGWGVTQTTLANERALIGGVGGGAGRTLDDLLALARRFGKDTDPTIRQEIADYYMRSQILRFLGYRVQTASAQGKAPGPEASIMKLLVSEHTTRNGNLYMAIEGAAGMLADDDAPAEGSYQQAFLGQWGSKIGGGTDQVQRNVVGERILGLPSEPRPDKTLPFRELATLNKR